MSMPKLFTLKQAAAQLNGKITANALRSMIKKGCLEVVRRGRRIYVTEEALSAMVVDNKLTAASTPRPVADNPHVCTYERLVPIDPPPGYGAPEQLRIFVTERKAPRKTQLSMIVTERKEPSKIISIPIIRLPPKKSS